MSSDALGRFCGFQLHTSNLDAARDFYVDALGWGYMQQGGVHRFLREDAPVATMVELATSLADKGVPSHWLGHVRVAGLEAAGSSWTERGGERLGETQATPGGGTMQRVRDPQGAILALLEGGEPDAVGCVWHDLYVTDHEAALETYAAEFGWEKTDAMDMGPLGTYQMYRWPDASKSAGGMSNGASMPGTHPHWLFYFEVDDLDHAVERIVALGGKILRGPMDVPGGNRIVIADDPQGSAFALTEIASS